MPLAILEGTQNDFVFVTSEILPEGTSREELAQKWCVHFGEEKPRDGFVVIENLHVDNKEARFSWDFYNCDGSKAAMCGNAARCAIVFIEKITGVKTSKWSTEIGTLFGEITEGGAKVFLPIGALKISPIDIVTKKETRTGHFLNSGVPHFVLILDEDTSTLSKPQALEIMNHESFLPEKTNVTLLAKSPSDEGFYKVKSFERGVHEYTQACGTGAIAAASVLKLIKGGNTWNIQMPGGLLVVELTVEGAYLSGPSSVLALNPAQP